MISTSIIREIRQAPHLAPYALDAFTFLQYLRSTQDLKFRIHGEALQEDLPPEDCTRDLEYVHRWTTTYRRGVLSKFYQLEDWHAENPTSITMMTLTTYHEVDKWGGKAHTPQAEGMTIPRSFEVLKSSWASLTKAIRYYLPGVPWVWIMEPHLNGYPHLHAVIFDDVTLGTQASIKKLWANYGAGSIEHGADFSVSKPETSIQSIRNYLVKYIAKGFTTTGSKFGEGDPWTPGQLVFYALVKKNGWRLFGASKDLCKVMAYNKKSDERITWYATQILDTDGNTRNTWVRPGYQAPMENPKER